MPRRRPPRNHITLRSLHPNHLHQIDPSLCLIYTPKGQAIMRDEEFYKNKPASMDRCGSRCGATSATTTPAASTCATSRPLARTSTACSSSCSTPGASNPAACRTACPRCSCGTRAAPTPASPSRTCSTPWALITKHATGHSWGKGGVEQSNNLVETHFESRLRFEPVESVEQLNASASRWVRDFNANAIEKVDCRLVRASASRWCATTSGSSSCATPAHWCECRRARCASGSWRARN